jgi:hypothetical protein
MRPRHILILAVLAAALLGLLLYLVEKPKPATPQHRTLASDEDPPADDPGRAPLPPVSARQAGRVPRSPDQPRTEPARPGYREYAVDNPDGSSRIVRDHRGQPLPTNLPRVPLTPDTFAKAQAAARPAVEACTARLPAGVGVGGHVGVVARITAVGGTSKLSEPRIRMAGFSDPGFEACMNEAIAATTFATPGQTDATYETALSFALPEH